MKTCKQCGEIKPIDQFRRYYGGRQGTYTMCRSCEKINSRAKYLEKKSVRATVAEAAELEKIYRLYDAQRACGLQPPRRESGRSHSVTDNLDELIESYTAKANAVEAPVGVIAPSNSELSNWLTCELTEEPDYYLDEVYEDLMARYRPILRVDQESYTPVYDDTYKTILEHILCRFNDYEDKYYEGD